MASIARYNPSFKGVGEMLCSGFMRRAMAARARSVKAVFAATAPKDTGEFAASARVETYIRKDFKGAGSRVVAAVVSDDPNGLAKEVGHIAPNGRFIPGDHALLKALHAAGGI
jgi:hypothetical protein